MLRDQARARRSCLESEIITGDKSEDGVENKIQFSIILHRWMLVLAEREIQLNSKDLFPPLWSEGNDAYQPHAAERYLLLNSIMVCI